MANWKAMAATYFIRKRRKKKKKVKPGKFLSLKKHIIPLNKEKINGQWVKRFSDDLFNRMTESELFFYRAAHTRRGGGCRLYPQFPLYGYIVDFYCVYHRVAIELDGGYHYNSEQKKYDEKRDDFLREQGICIVRFANTLDQKQVENYLYRIKQICQLRQAVGDVTESEAPVAVLRKSGTRQS